MSYSLHPGAEQDIANALDFYREHAGPLVANHFLEAFQRIAILLLKYPDMGVPIKNGRRFFPLKVFPYSVVYRSHPDGILILIVRHQHRKPGYANSRR